MRESSATRRLSAAVGVLLVVLAPLSPVGTADADPLPATYTGSTHGDILDIGLTNTVTPITAVVGHSSTTTNSTTANRAHAESANIHAGALGLGVGVVSDSANSTTSTQNDSYTAGLGEVDVPGTLDTGLVTGDGSTRWDGDAACVPDGTTISQSTTQVAGATLGIPAVQILNLGTTTTTGSTTLNSGSVRSTSAGNIASLTLVDGLVNVNVVTQPQLTATSNGTTGSVTANNYAVDVTILGVTTRVNAGGSIPINLTVGGVTSVALTLSVGSLTDTSSGATGSGSTTFLRITGAITVLLGGATLANVNVGILPLSVSATAPTGGVECGALDPPVITSPTNGATTGETPTISGTGIPGATVTVTEGPTTIGTAVVAGDGTWSLVPSTPLSLGSHTISATQKLGTPVSGPSNAVTFTVADQTPPGAPVVTTPANGSTTADSTPTITGTGEPGATVTVRVDGTPVGTTTVDGTGNWTLTPGTPLADGPHTVNATQTDAAGNTSPVSNTNTVTIDTAAAAPVITAPAQGSTTNDSTPTITGTAEPGASVQVTIDGTVVGTTTADGAGNWTLTPGTPLADGPHLVIAVQTDPVGNTSPAASKDFTVDTAAAAPVVVNPANGSVTNDTTPTITGTAESGATVTVSVDGTVIGTTTANGAGSWTLTPSTPLADGSHTVNATQTDPAGNTSGVSNTNTFTIDTNAPNAPVVTAPADGSTTNDTTPTITGTAEPGATVTVRIDGTIIGTTTADGTGSWTFLPVTPLADGPHTVNATQTDPAGNTSPASNTNSFTIDTTAPGAPVVATPATGSVTNDTTPTITGTAEPGATVTVSVDGTVIGTTTANGTGNWTLTPSTPLAEGSHTVNATQTDPAGNTSGVSNTNTFSIDTTAAAPAVLTPANGSTTNDSTPVITGTAEANATVTVSIDGTVIGTTTADGTGSWTFLPLAPLADGPHTVNATQTDPAGNTSGVSNTNAFTIDTTAAAPVVVNPANGSVTNDTTPTITGTAEPGATVTVRIDGTIIGTTTANGAGSWTLTPSTPLADGPHTVNATQTDTAGNTSGVSNTNTFTIDTAAPGAPVVSTPANGSVTTDTTPTITGTAEPGATVTVSVDGTVIGTTTANGTGDWTFLPLTPLLDGPHTVNATQTDTAGNTSPVSNTNTFTVDATAPGAPVVSTPANGSVTNDTTPTITGTADPGATVTVRIDGTPVGTTTADGTGSWTLTPGTPLAEGPHTVDATQTDTAGNTSPASAGRDFTIDTTATAPVVVTPADGSTTDDATPTITGTAEPGATVTVSVDGSVTGTTTADGTGHWTLTPSTPLADGPHTVDATQTDTAGNTSPASSGNDFTVDTTAPAAPVITAPADASTIHDRTPTIDGTGEPGATVSVKIDGIPIGTTTVDGTGHWSIEPTTPLLDGPHTVTATQTDPAGNPSPADSQDFRVDVVDPLQLTSGGTGSSTDPTPTFEGTGEPGTTVDIAIDGEKVGTTVVRDDGTWTFTTSEPLACGSHQMSAQVPGSSAPPQTGEFEVTCSTDNGLPESGLPDGLNRQAGLGLTAVLAGWLLVRIGHARRRPHLGLHRRA